VINRVSNNVGGVKHFWGALARALRRARHFALVEELPYQPRLARNRFRSGTQSDPCISSVTTSIMITTSNSPVKGSGIPNRMSRKRLRCSVGVGPAGQESEPCSQDRMRGGNEAHGVDRQSHPWDGEQVIGL